jgi:hypothetical protein
MWKHIIIQSLVELILLILLYIYAPEFIKEDDVVRLAENRIIERCYTKFPGNPKKIIFGTSTKWETKVKLRNNATEAFCGGYHKALI